EDMLGQDLLLVVQFLAIVLFNSPLSEACAPLTPGKEKIMSLELHGFNLPLRMVYSTNRKAQVQVPSISASKEGALSAINGYVEKKLHRIIRDQMNGKGLSMEDRYKVVDQIQFMSSSYNPMQCNNVNVQPANTRADALIRFDSESSGSAYNCVVNEDRIGSICPGTKCSVNGGEVAVGDHKEQFASLQPIPQEFVTYKVNLKIYNADVANWSNSTWKQILGLVEESLENGIYGKQFTGTTIKII
uniref:Vitellogenin domain-containing protein n=1 Tax=Haemonchus contortus TaxID=6289 RepID=A0A7I4YTS4_HAECO